jgi:hypothetical protein
MSPPFSKGRSEFMEEKMTANKRLVLSVGRVRSLGITAYVNIPKLTSILFRIAGIAHCLVLASAWAMAQDAPPDLGRQELTRAEGFRALMKTSVCEESFGNIPSRADRAPKEVLGSTRSIIIVSKTAFLKPDSLETELLKLPEFQSGTLAITTDVCNADLVLEVDRVTMTRSFTLRAIDPYTRYVVAGGKGSAALGSAASRLSSQFIKQYRKAQRGQKPSKN